MHIAHLARGWRNLVEAEQEATEMANTWLLRLFIGC